MSTRATIAVRRDDGMYAAVYMHFDGYPTHAGEVLMQHYANQSDAEALVAGGELRCLDHETGQPEHYTDGARPATLPTELLDALGDGGDGAVIDAGVVLVRLDTIKRPQFDLHGRSFPKELRDGKGSVVGWVGGYLTGAI